MVYNLNIEKIFYRVKIKVDFSYTMKKEIILNIISFFVNSNTKILVNIIKTRYNIYV